jgi:hypothetical protein
MLNVANMASAADANATSVLLNLMAKCVSLDSP